MCLSAPEDACIWDAQGGPDSTEVKNDPYYNQWEDLDDSPIGWHITEVRSKLGERNKFDRRGRNYPHGRA